MRAPALVTEWRHEQTAALNFKRPSDTKSHRVVEAADHDLNGCRKAFGITHGYAQGGEVQQIDETGVNAERCVGIVHSVYGLGCDLRIPVILNAHSGRS